MTNLITLSGITKSFAGLQALADVNFAVDEGQVCALCGENGAGKSTLIRILGGEVRPDRGSIEVDGQAVSLSRPTDAIERGIFVIHQEMAVAPDLSVAENIFLGNLPGRLGWRDLNRRASELIERLGFDIPPRQLVRELSVAHQQVVEIAKALSREARVIVFDEPTAVLPFREAQRLLEIIRGLCNEGVGVVYISHRLDEIFAIADRICVLKDGRNAGELPPDSGDVDQLIRMMVGRPLSQLFGDKPDTKIGEQTLTVDNLTLPNGVRDVSFSLRRGQVVGLGGLVGSGRTEVARAIFGADPISSGTMTVNGRPFHPRNPKQAVQHGINLVPEDRKGQGVVLDMGIEKNMTMAKTKGLTRLGFFRFSKERDVVAGLIRSLQIKLGSPSDPVSSLSGGNQQKVVLAKWFHSGGDVVILDEPTRGVDVGAKNEIYTLIHRMAAAGKSVLVISSEHAELFGLCDSVLVMGGGRLCGTLSPDEYTEEKLLALSISGMRQEPEQTA